MNINISGEVVRTSQLPKRIIGLGDYLVALNSSPLETSTVLVSDFVSFLNTQFATSLASLTDVSINGPLSGQALVYDGSRWVNQGIGELDTLDSVTTRGNTTTNNITVGTLYFGDGNHYLVTDNASYAMLSSNRTLQLATSGNPVLSVFTSQNVGIGTTTDVGSKLQVKSSITNGTGTEAIRAYGISNYIGMHYDEGRGPVFTTNYAGVGGNSPGSFNFYTSVGSLLASIGSGGVYSHNVNGKVSSGNNNGFINLWNGGSGDMELVLTTNHNLTFSTNNTERLRITNAGNVGIGTTSPTYNLEVSSTGYSGIGIMSGANSSAEINFRNTGYALPRWTIRATGTPNGSSGNLTFQRLANTFPFTITSGDNVLIGTSVDSGFKLDVNGTGRFTNQLTVVNNGVSIGNVLLNLNSQGTGTISSGNSVGNPTTYITMSGPVYYNPTSGVAGTFAVTGQSYMSSGTAQFNTLTVGPTINNTGTYSGIFRGFYYNPTLTSLTGTTHRAIETTSGNVIFNGGNVSIGTTAVVPGNILTINGSVTISAGQGLSLDVGAGIYMVAASSQFRLYNNSFAALSIANTGNVLINTTTDSGYKLDVVGATRIQGSLKVDTFGTDNTATIGGSLALNSSITALNKAQTTYIPLLTRNTIGSEVVYDLSNIGSITATGNVGIGTSSPSSALEISQTTPIVRLDSSAVGSFHGIEFTNTGNIDAEIKQLPSSGEFRISNGRFAGWNGFITLYTDTVERMRIRSNGNVLIGATADAGYKLDVNGTGRFSGNLEVNAGANGQIFINNLYPRLLFGKTGTPSWSMYVDTENSGQFEIGTGAGFPYNTFTSRLYISSGGNVGIGTNSPSNKLDVVGNIEFGAVNVSDTWRPVLGVSSLVYPQPFLAVSNADPSMSRFNIALKTDTIPDATNTVTGFTGPQINLWNSGVSKFLAINTDGLQVSNGTSLLLQPNLGNVLIGTTTDAGYKLDVNGTTRVTTGTAGTGIHLTSTVSGNTGTFVISPNSTAIGSLGDFTIATPNGTRLFISGNYQTLITSSVGLSVSSALQVGGNLSVSGGGASSIITTDLIIGGNNNTSSSIYFTSSGYTESKILWRVENQGTYGVSNLHLCINGNTTTTRATIADARVSFLSNGNVGIGTTAPIGKLDVKDGEIFVTTSTNANLRSRLTYQGLYVSRASDGTYPEQIISTNSAWQYHTRNGHVFYRDSSPYLTLGGLTAGSFINVNTTGNVLINSSTDNGYKLQVNGNAYLAGSAGTTTLNVDFGNVNSNVKILSHGSSDFTQIQIGNNFSLSRNGGGDPSIGTTFGLGIISNSLSLQTSTASPGKLWLKGNYGLGSAYFGANNSNGVTASTLYFQNSETPTAAQNVVATFNLWGVSDNATAPTIPASSMFSLHSTTRGFLKPRLTSVEKNAITTPATGLEVYDSTTNTPNYYNGTTWVGVASNQSTGLSPGLFAQTSDSTPVANTTVETTLISTGVGTLSVPANQFQVGDSYVAYLSGVISSQNNATLEIHLRSNGFVLADTNPMTLSATTGKFWELHVNFTIRAIGGGGVAAIVTSGRFSYNKDSGNTPESLGFSAINNTTFDTTINNTLVITATWGNASPLNSIYSRIFNLYRVY